MRKAVRAALSTARTARTPGPLARYGQLVTKGRLRRDAAQVAVLEHLGRLHRVLAREREARDADAALEARCGLLRSYNPHRECLDQNALKCR